MTTNFHLAPPPNTVDGLLAVPMDIKSIEAVFIFDGALETASADATINYTVGPTAGHPIFDLRQNITQSWLDGVLFPVSQLSHHAFGTNPFTELRVIQSVQAVGSVHTLRVQYTLALPNSQLGGGYLPALEWSAGPKLKFVFGLSDLNKARYVEAWLPANLIFDQFDLRLEIQIVNTLAAHSVITNSAATELGTNHWRIVFPGRFTALSPMLEIWASDALLKQTDSTLLPVSARTVVIEVWKPVASAVDLGVQINTIKTLLAQNENDYGPYLHDGRFVAFFNGNGGMEYEGGTTTSTGALAHETFHSWFARGIKPASHADGWWDEGFTSFHDDGADDVIPFDFSDPPVTLCSLDPWQRHTPMNAYSDGNNFCKGMASLLGLATFKSSMGALYNQNKGNPVSPAMIEEFLLCNSGNEQVVDAFHRYAYGFPDPSPAPDLWLKDDPAHSGTDDWGGAFWDSPDLWIRNQDDGGLDHQSPEYGQDNWFHARVRNKAGAGVAKHFVVTFHARGFLGTEFVYPNDFLPCTAAKAEFELAPGDTHIVKAKWPPTLVPPQGTHTCLLASVLARSEHPVAGRHVWEHNNLAQKNLVIVDLLPDMFMILPIVLGNWFSQFGPGFHLEIWKPEIAKDISFSLVHQSKDFFGSAKVAVKEFIPALPRPAALPEDGALLDCGGHIPGLYAFRRGRILSSDNTELIQRRFSGAWEAVFRKECKEGQDGHRYPSLQPEASGPQTGRIAPGEARPNLNIPFRAALHKDPADCRRRRCAG